MSEERAEGMHAWPTGRLLATASRLVEHAWTQKLDRLGLTHAGLVVLHLLQDGPLSQTDLARLARVENQTISRTLERLQREDFVERRPDESDRRRHVVTVTQAGIDVWNAAQSLERDMMPTVNDSELFRQMLLQVIDSSAAKRWEP
ncbi:MarR family winged helix-turn-helix transcriptional regulator [Agreia sp. COWG]|uniref:MarR family winged helix-turn-helix transcriptional regulator n=1 Tax=Agreia sp. COWG TaxID=2773266 RepID=UPI001F0057E9|nr:MarR family transcriptional regulator [Agreia sp. COWG]